MSARPNRLDRRTGGAVDEIMAKASGVDPAQQAQQARQAEQQARYRGLTADAPPLNQTFGQVVTFEKTDLMFVLLAIQTLVLVAIWRELR